MKTNITSVILISLLAGLGRQACAADRESYDKLKFSSLIRTKQPKETLSGLRHGMATTIADMHKNEAKSWSDPMLSDPEYVDDVASITPTNKNSVLNSVKKDIYLAIMDELTLNEKYRRDMLGSESNLEEIDPAELKEFAEKISQEAMVFIRADVEERLRSKYK